MREDNVEGDRFDKMATAICGSAGKKDPKLVELVSAALRGTAEMARDDGRQAAVPEMKAFFEAMQTSKLDESLRWVGMIDRLIGLLPQCLECRRPGTHQWSKSSPLYCEEHVVSAKTAMNRLPPMTDAAPVIEEAQAMVRSVKACIPAKK